MPEQRLTINARRLAKAASYYQSGRCKRAASICSRVLRDDPGNIDAICLMAMLSYERGEVEDALKMLNEARTSHPENPLLTDTLADLCVRTEDYVTAEGALRAALIVNKGSIDLEVRLADVLSLSGDAREAVTLYSSILERQPEHIGARLNLGSALRNLGEIEPAIAELERTVALAPDSPDAAGTLAEFYEQLNRVKDAAQLAETALRRWPTDPRLNLVAARCMRRAGQATEALQMLAGLPANSMNRNDLAAHHYERGTLLDRLDQPEGAMAAFSEANRLAAESWAQSHPEPNAYARKVAGLRTAFTPELVSGWTQTDCPPPEDCPVFLVGFPRSGTTLLDQLLDSHPGTQVMEERGLIAVLQHELTLQRPFPQVLATLDHDGIQALRDRYYSLSNSQIVRQPGGLLIDKLPLNITNAGLIFRIFPKARFILAVRHPADVCLSCFMQNFQPNDAMANFFSLESTVDFYAATMALWDQYREQLPLAVHTVRYEDLIEDFRGQAENLLEFLGLPWDESVLRFHEHAQRRSRINTPSYHQVSRPLYKEARFRWHRYREQLEPSLPQLAPWIKAFGYEQESPPSAD